MINKIIISIILVSSSFAFADSDPSQLRNMLNPLFVCGHDIPNNIGEKQEQHKAEIIERLYLLEPDRLVSKLTDISLSNDKLARQQLYFIIELLSSINNNESSIALDTIYENAASIAERYLPDETETISAPNTESMDINADPFSNNQFKRNLITNDIQRAVDVVRL